MDVDEVYKRIDEVEVLADKYYQKTINAKSVEETLIISRDFMINLLKLFPVEIFDEDLRNKVKTFLELFIDKIKNRYYNGEKYTNTDINKQILKMMVYDYDFFKLLAYEILGRYTSGEISKLAAAKDLLDLWTEEVIQRVPCYFCIYYEDECTKCEYAQYHGRCSYGDIHKLDSFRRYWIRIITGEVLKKFLNRNGFIIAHDESTNEFSLKYISVDGVKTLFTIYTIWNIKAYEELYNYIKTFANKCDVINAAVKAAINVVKEYEGVWR